MILIGPAIAVMLVALIGAMGADGAEGSPEGETSGEPGPAVGKIVAIVVATALVLGAGSLLVYWLVTDDQGDAVTISLYGFSVKGEVFDGKIIPAFISYYKNKTGIDVTFATQYAGSGKVTSEVIQGAPADVMILSTEWDALQLKKEGLATTDWNDFPHQGTVSTSPWVILVRTANPKNIEDFEDLGNPGTTLVHPDPLTSGGACWSLFSIYGSQLIKSNETEGFENETQADELMNAVVDNVLAWPSSAREAMTLFAENEIGDALITYENEAILAVEKGYGVEIVYPESTISSEHKVVLVDANIDAEERPVLEEFVQFIYTSEVQEFMCEENFRSVDESINVHYPGFPPIEKPFLVSYLDGWEVAHEELIEGKYVEFLSD